MQAQLHSTTRALRVTPGRGLKFYVSAGLRFPPHRGRDHKPEHDGKPCTVSLDALIPTEEERRDLTLRLGLARDATPEQVRDARVAKLMREPNLIVEQIDHVPEEAKAATPEQLARENEELRDRIAALEAESSDRRSKRGKGSAE